MDRPLKIVVYIVLGLVVFHLVFDLFNTRSNIKTVIKNLEKSKQNIESALNEIKSSQGRLDSMRKDLELFGNYVKDIQGRVAQTDNEKRKEEARTVQERDSLKVLIKKGKEEFFITDTVHKLITVKWQ